MGRRIEVAFDSLYLGTVLTMGIVLLITPRSMIPLLFGVMALILVTGDAFHLVPRIGMSLGARGLANHLGRGKMIASVGMTLFYVVLWHIGVLSFAPPHAPIMTGGIYLLATIRIVLTLMPQNNWKGDSSSVSWSLFRNGPFVLQGFGVGLLFFCYRNAPMNQFGWMWLAILLSFACYLPVVFGAKKYPALGMLMLPKSCAYVWIIAMGL